MQNTDVLVVDDNDMNLELASLVLTSVGLTVDTATDAETAVAQIDRCRPRLVLMDIQMPRVDGLALTRILRARPGGEDLVVVAFTAYAMRGDEDKMRAAGCDGYIAKPIDVATFAAQVRAYLED